MLYEYHTDTYNISILIILVSCCELETAQKDSTERIYVCAWGIHLRRETSP